MARIAASFIPRLCRHLIRRASEHWFSMFCFCILNDLCVLPDSQADVIHNIGQRDIFGLKGLPLLLEFVRQTDPPPLFGHPLSHFLRDVSAHEVRCGLLAPLRGHICTTFHLKELEKRGEWDLYRERPPPLVN